MERTISMMVGKGSLNHNNRMFTAKNVDAERSKCNKVYVKESIKKVYHALFDEALEAYNSKQTRADRRIDNYYEKIRTSKQEKLFHELIVQIGNREDTNCNMLESVYAQLALEDYMNGFQERNPNLWVFNAVMHLDEETPHLHIDYVPFSTGNKRGLETKASLKGALKAQGFVGTGRFDTELKRWVESEKECLAEIMERYQMKWLQKGTHEKHLSVYDFEKKMRKAEVEELEQEISDQKDKIASQSFAMEVNEEALQSQEQILEENEAKVQKIRQETEKAKEDWEKVQTDKDRAQDSYEHYKSLEESTKGLYELYHSWYEDKKKSYEEYAEKSSMLEKKANSLEGQIKELKQRKSDKAEEVQAEEIKLDIVKMQLQKAVNDFGDVQKQADFVKEQAMRQYEKYRKVEPSERGTAMFDDMLRLKRENMILKDENKTLKEKLQKAYDFMKQFTINGLNMLERFLASIGERVQSFSESIGFSGRSR
ncbi:MAG: plasmid recombination protein [Lachnospiraceae bacterium]|nr:plasmid recombination protein [Lachnospiraceae bacterium]